MTLYKPDCIFLTIANCMLLWEMACAFLSFAIYAKARKFAIERTSHSKPWRYTVGLQQLKEVSIYLHSIYCYPPPHPPPPPPSPPPPPPPTYYYSVLLTSFVILRIACYTRGRERISKKRKNNSWGN